MNLIRLSLNTLYRTTPLYKIKPGTPVLLFDTSVFKTDSEACLVSVKNPNTDKVVVITHTGKIIEFPDKRAVVLFSHVKEI